MHFGVTSTKYIRLQHKFMHSLNITNGSGIEPVQPVTINKVFGLKHLAPPLLSYGDYIFFMLKIYLLQYAVKSNNHHCCINAKTKRMWYDKSYVLLYLDYYVLR